MITIGNKKNGAIGEYVGRPSPLGNPFPLSSEQDRDECVGKYQKWLYDKIKQKDDKIIKELKRLADIARNRELMLVCWCAPKKCHADIISKVLKMMISNSK
jgi:hypothetical protein